MRLKTRKQEPIKHANEQTSKQTNKQANKQANKQTNAQNNNTKQSKIIIEQRQTRGSGITTKTYIKTLSQNTKHNTTLTKT